MTQDAENKTETEVVETPKEPTKEAEPQPKPKSAVMRVAGEVIYEIAGKLPSRKLAVWTVATVAFFMGKMDPDLWSYLSIGYIGTEALLSYGKSKFAA